MLFNGLAKTTMLKVLPRVLSGQSRHTAQVSARCHFALGNVYRDRGDTAKAIEHLQIAANLSAEDLELSCWAHVRLIVVLSELAAPKPQWRGSMMLIGP